MEIRTGGGGGGESGEVKEVDKTPGITFQCSRALMRA